MNTVARLLPVICAAGISGVFAGDPVVSESDEPPSQPAMATSPQPVAQSPAVTPTDPSTTNVQPLANKPVRKVLVDDTVTDAQLKQIFRKGYKPEGQAHGNEVNYCRRELELGSHFETKVCKTAAQILQAEQGSKEATTYVQRTGAASEGARH